MPVSWVILGKLPSAARCLSFLTWNKGGVLASLSCLVKLLEGDLSFVTESWGLRQTMRNAFGPSAYTP